MSISWKKSNTFAGIRLEIGNTESHSGMACSETWSGAASLDREMRTAATVEPEFETLKISAFPCKQRPMDGCTGFAVPLP